MRQRSNISPAICFCLWILSWIHTPSAFAKIGLAEWDVLTPGTNIVCHSDPYASDHGTCLRSNDRAPGSHPTTIYVSNIEWWQYYTNHVVGKAEKGFFLFDETKKTVSFHATESALRDQITQAKLGKAVSRPLTDHDGWGLVWIPLLQQQVAAMKTSPEYKDMPEARRKQIEEEAKKLKVPDIRPTDPE